MAVAFVKSLGSNQSKTAGTSLAISGLSENPATGDDIFLAYAGDDVGSAFGVTDTGTASITWTQEKEHINAGNVKAQLWRGAVTAGGTLTAITISWTTNVTAKAIVAGLFSGVGTQDGTDSVSSGGASYGCPRSNVISWQTGDLVIDCAAWEGPGTDNLTAAETGTSNLSPAEVAQNGTTGGGAATNVTAQLLYGIAGANSVGGDSLNTVNNTSARDSASAGAVYSPAASGTPHTVNPSDSVALADARTFSQGQAQADSVALADAFSRVSVSARAVDDSVALTDARALSVGKALADSVALTDSATPVLTTDHVVQPSDSVALSDALTISWTQDLAGDTVALSDSFSRVHVAERSVSDSVVLSDQATPVNEAGGTDHTVNPDDSLSLSDTFSRVLDYARTQSDGINLTDQALDAQGIRLGDMVALTDALARVHEAARQVADSVALTDAIALSQGELIADAVALSDQLSSALDLARTISDSVSLSDATTFSQGKAITDAVALADQLTRVATFARDIADSVALTDQVTPTETGEGEQAVNDFITLSDQFSRVADFARTIADSVLVSDAVTMDRALLFSDLVGLTDQTTAQEGQGFTEAINDLLSLSDLVTPVHVVGPLPTLPGVGGPSGPLRPGRRKRRERIQAEEEEIITVLLSEL